MNTTVNAYNNLIREIKYCNNKEQVKSVIKQVLGIDENHLFFNEILEKLCERNGIDTTNDLVDIIVTYLDNHNNSIRSYQASANIENFAEKILNKFNVLKSLTMNQFRKIANECGFVVANTFKSTKTLTNLIRANQV